MIKLTEETPTQLISLYIFTETTLVPQGLLININVVSLKEQLTDLKKNHFYLGSFRIVCVYVLSRSVVSDSL